MRYIITESRLNKVIEKYLESLYENWDFSDLGDNEFDIYDGEKIIIKYRNADWDSGLYYFIPSLVWSLSDLFGVEVTDVIYPLIDWLNNKFDKYVEYSGWDYEM